MDGKCGASSGLWTVRTVPGNGIANENLESAGHGGLCPGNVVATFRVGARRGAGPARRGDAMAGDHRECLVARPLATNESLTS